MDKDLYDLAPEEESQIPTVCYSLDEALEALDNDREFLKVGEVFSDDLIDGYLELKEQELTPAAQVHSPGGVPVVLQPLIRSGQALSDGVVQRGSTSPAAARLRFRARTDLPTAPATRTAGA